jgi:hypothetical protein
VSGSDLELGVALVFAEYRECEEDDGFRKSGGAISYSHLPVSSADISSSVPKGK